MSCFVFWGRFLFWLYFYNWKVTLSSNVFKKQKRHPNGCLFVEERIEISNILADLQEIEILMKMLNGNLDSE